MEAAYKEAVECGRQAQELRRRETAERLAATEKGVPYFDTAGICGQLVVLKHRQEQAEEVVKDYYRKYPE